VARQVSSPVFVCVGEITSSNPDITPPVVALSGIIAGPPKQVQLSTHDTQSGFRPWGYRQQVCNFLL
jgi:hypothetical protein